MSRAAADDEDCRREAFAVRGPSAERPTAKALAELDAGKGKRFDSADELYKALGI